MKYVSQGQEGKGKLKYTKCRLKQRASTQTSTVGPAQMLHCVKTENPGSKHKASNAEAPLKNTAHTYVSSYLTVNTLRFHENIGQLMLINTPQRQNAGFLIVIPRGT